MFKIWTKTGGRFTSARVTPCLPLNRQLGTMLICIGSTVKKLNRASHLPWSYHTTLCIIKDSNTLQCIAIIICNLCLNFRGDANDFSTYPLSLISWCPLCLMSCLRNIQPTCFHNAAFFVLARWVMTAQSKHLLMLLCTQPNGSCILFVCGKCIFEAPLQFCPSSKMSRVGCPGALV